MIDKNYSQLILKDIEEGDQIGGPYELAKILLESLNQINGFNENDLRNKYLDWWKGEAFDTGPTYASVFNKINKGMDPQLAVKGFMKSLDLIQLDVGLLQSALLASISNISIDELISLARQEAKITHFHDDAGNGSAIVNLFCRYSLEGKNFEDTEYLISTNFELKDSWLKLKNAELKPDGYIYNVIFSALHFIKENKTLEDAIKFSGKSNYCSIIFGVIKRCLMRN